MHRSIAPTTAAVLATVLALGLLLLPASADARWAVPRTWAERIRETDGLLRDGEYRAARKKAEQVVEEMGRVLLAGENSDRAMATALTLLALGQAGTGEQREAEWSWHLAQSLDPDLHRRDLAPYGESGRRLEEVQREAGEAMMRRPERQDDDGEDDPADAPAAGEGPVPEGGAAEGREGDGEAEDGEECDELTPPVKRKAPHPKYPPALRRSGVEGPVVFHLVLDAEGRLTRPFLVEAPSPGLGYVVAETIRNWVFEPALCDGEPREVYYNLTVNMSLGR